MNLYSLKHT